MNRTHETRLNWTIRLVGIGFIGGILLSWNLWTSRRDYPLFPVWDRLPQFSPGVSSLVALLLLCILVWMVIQPGRWNVAVFIVMVFFLALQDQSRWQPWAYQYGLMLLPCVFLRSGKNERALIGLLQFITVMVYLWGGIHKCQPGWLSVWERSMVAPLLAESKEGFVDSLVLGLGYLVPVIEILMALGLVFRKTRFPAIVIIILTHVTILALLGPVKGTISNSVVWPWNIVMSAMVILLFYHHECLFLEALKVKPLLPVSVLLFVLMTVAPVLFYFALWDRYLSFSLYAGQQKRILVQIPVEALDHVLETWKPYLVDPNAKDGHQILSPGTWSSRELNVPLISEWRILRSFARKLCEEDLAGAELRFYIDHTHLPNKPKQYFRCDEVDQIGEDTMTD